MTINYEMALTVIGIVITVMLGGFIPWVTKIASQMAAMKVSLDYVLKDLAGNMNRVTGEISEVWTEIAKTKDRIRKLEDEMIRLESRMDKCK